MSLNSSISDESSNHKYYSEVPNIIFEIGLKAHQISLYLVIKRSAGENGCCTKSSSRLCQEAGIGTRNFPKIKQSLAEVNKFLKKPLIRITPRFSEFGDQETDSIVVVDVWDENMAFFLEKKGGTAKLQVPPRKIAGGVPQNCREGTAKLQDKEEPFKKNLYKKDHHQASSSKKAEKLMIDDDLLQKEKLNKKADIKKTQTPIEEKILICRDVYLTREQLNSCVEAKGSLKNVEEAICQLLDWEGREHEIKNWEKSIKAWKIKKKKEDTFELNQKIGISIIGQIAENPNWKCKIHRDTIKDDYGLLFENYLGAVAQPHFFSMHKKTFQNDVLNFLKEKKVPSKKSVIK